MSSAAISLLDNLERRLLRAAAAVPKRRPWIEAERNEILQATCRCLGIRDDRIPDIRARVANRFEGNGFSTEMLVGESWDGCRCAAHLYLPQKKTDAPWPLVLLCCGHAKDCKLSPGYQALAWRLARMGAAVLVPDNIGQGEREPMGHREAFAAFQCGLSLQGLIVMETMAWLDRVRSDKRFDNARIAAVGNSGGGTLTVFLQALRRDQLAAVCSSGYPGTFEFVARKEKQHCACNLLPGIVGEIEMWQLYGSFAPKPLFLFQGNGDHLFPEDLFHTNARKVLAAYRAAGGAENLRAEVFQGGHSWDDGRRKAMGDFLRGPLGLSGDWPDAEVDALPGNCYDAWPDDARTADDVAFLVAGRQSERVRPLWDTFPVDLSEEQNMNCGRVDAIRLAAQFRLFLRSADGEEMVTSPGAS